MTFRGGAAGWLAWTAAGLLLVLLVPPLARSGELLWTRPPEQLPQHLAMGVAFLAYVVVLRALAERQGRVPLAAAVGAGALVFGLAYAALAVQSQVPHSRVLMGMSMVVGGVAGLLPYLGMPLRLVGAAAGAAAIGLAAFAFPADVAAEDGPPPVRVVSTAQQRVNVATYPSLVETGGADGGALAPYGDGFVLVTGAGELYELGWRGEAPTATRLPLRVPQNRAEFLDAHSARTTPPRLRATGLVMDTAGGVPRVIVASQYWDTAGTCLTMRVSAAPLDGTAAPGEWTTLFEARPCIRFAPPYSEWETGGRLAWAADGALLLSLGDHGYDDSAADAFAQRMDTEYGKVVRLDPRSGAHEIVSAGHRNPQGLTVARDGRVWLAEHGPQGGDEINLIESGANYGWPLVTYGTDYGLPDWPLAAGARDHGSFREPAYTLVPAIGITSLVQIRGDRFPAWRGDLLAGSLRGRQLLRMRLRDDRIIFAEPIPIGPRVRDLAQARDGRIVLWTDPGDVLVLSPAPAMSPGEAAFQPCAACHRRGDENDAPRLGGIVGADVARSDVFPYSEALRRLGGAWTRERLDAFLADPNAFAPGTQMWYSVPDESQRAAVIEYLESYR